MTNESSSDKLLGLKQQKSEVWQEKCIYCYSKNLEISPVNVVYRPQDITDFSDLPDSVRSYYQKLPTIVDAVEIAMETKDGTILIDCKDCGNVIRGFANERPDSTSPVPNIHINKNRLRAYLSKYYNINESEELLHRIRTR
jgi:ribosomal protein L34E